MGKGVLPPTIPHANGSVARATTRQSLTSRGTSLPPIQGVQGAKEGGIGRTETNNLGLRAGSAGNSMRRQRQHGAVPLTARESPATPRDTARRNRLMHSGAPANKNGYPDC